MPGDNRPPSPQILTGIEAKPSPSKSDAILLVRYSYSPGTAKVHYLLIIKRTLLKTITYKNEERKRLLSLRRLSLFLGRPSYIAALVVGSDKDCLYMEVLDQSPTM